jgi:hypothetical protein
VPAFVGNSSRSISVRDVQGYLTLTTHPEADGQWNNPGGNSPFEAASVDRIEGDQLHNAVFILPCC